MSKAPQTGLTLSRDEIYEMTRARTRARQVKFLVSNGIRHYLDEHGWPVVLRSAVDDKANEPAANTPIWKSNKAA